MGLYLVLVNLAVAAALEQQDAGDVLDYGVVEAVLQDDQVPIERLEGGGPARRIDQEGHVEPQHVHFAHGRLHGAELGWRELPGRVHGHPLLLEGPEEWQGSLSMLSRSTVRFCALVS